MESLITEILVGNAPTILAIAFWAHRIDKRITLIEAYIWPKNGGRFDGKA